jgi:hypothetical protein
VKPARPADAIARLSESAHFNRLTEIYGQASRAAQSKSTSGLE